MNGTVLFTMHCKSALNIITFNVIHVGGTDWFDVKFKLGLDFPNVSREQNPTFAMN